MGEQKSLAKARLPIADLGIDRQSRQRPAPLKKGRLECKRHQRRLYRSDLQAKLPCDVITEPGGADLRNRQATGGNHHRLAGHRRTGCLDDIAIIRGLDTKHLRVQTQLGAGIPAFTHKHIDDLLRTVVAEKLAKFLFVEGDLMLRDKLHEIILRIPAERRFAEMHVVRQKAAGLEFRLVKLQRPPPEMRIFPPVSTHGR